MSSGTSSRSGPTRRTRLARSSRPQTVTGPDFTHDAADALAYNFPVTGNGWNSGDLTSMARGAAWHMSVDELLRVMATFRHSGAIVSTAQAQAMLDDGFGIDWSVPTPLGRYYAKNGIWPDNSGRRRAGCGVLPAAEHGTGDPRQLTGRRGSDGPVPVHGPSQTRTPPISTKVPPPIASTSSA